MSLIYFQASLDLSRRKVKINRPRKSRLPAPVIDDRFTGVVRDLSTDGRGVIQAPDGQVVFVAGVWQGEEVEIERSRRGKSTSAELISLLRPKERNEFRRRRFTASRPLYFDFLALPDTRHKDNLPIGRLNHSTTVSTEIANNTCKAIIDDWSRQS